MSRRKSPRHAVTVEIAGEKHVLRSDVDPDYTRAVAAHVDATLTALGPAQSFEPHRNAILAALSITDQLFRAREEVERLRAEVTERVERLVDSLERVLDDDPPSGAPRAEGR